MTKFAVALVALGLNYYLYAFFASNEVIPPREAFSEFPTQIESWKCRQWDTMDQATLDNLGATDYLLCDFGSAQEKAVVSLYVGYHASQVRRYDGDDKTTSIHPPEHCLPGSGWDVVDGSIVPFASGDKQGEAKRFVIAKGEHRQLVYFWYETQGRMIARNPEVIFYKFWDRATRNRTDGALVRLTTPIRRGNEQQAEDIIRKFAAATTPLFRPYLPN